MRSKYNKLSPNVYDLKFSCVNLALLFFILVLIPVLFLILPKETQSEDEKRELATVSPITANTIFSGTTASEITEYVSDHFPLRKYFIAFSDQLANMRGFSFDDVKIHGSVPTVPNVPVESSSAPTPPNSQTPVQSASGDEENLSDSEEDSSGSSASDSSASENSSETTTGEQYGSTFIYKDRAMGLFGYNKEMGKWYASALNKYAEALGDDVKIYNMIVPTSIDFYIPEKYKQLTQPQKPSIDNIYENLSTKITSIDAYSILEKHKDEYIYFRTDHHWTGLGAYYAYTEFAKKAGFTPVDIKDFETKRLDNFLGTLYGQTKDGKLRENPDYVDYYMIGTPHQAYRYVKNAPYNPIPSTIHGEYAVSPNSYSVFLHGDFPLTRIDTNIKNGRKIAVVKESYGNAFAPFLANHYEQVYIIDERYFQLGFINFIKQNGINELIFVNNTMAANTPYHIRNIENIMYQQFYVPTTPPSVESSSSETPSSSESSSSKKGTIIIKKPKKDSSSSSNSNEPIDE